MRKTNLKAKGKRKEINYSSKAASAWTTLICVDIRSTAINGNMATMWLRIQHFIFMKHIWFKFTFTWQFRERFFLKLSMTNYSIEIRPSVEQYFLSCTVHMKPCGGNVKMWSVIQPVWVGTWDLLSNGADAVGPCTVLLIARLLMYEYVFDFMTLNDFENCKLIIQI